LCERRAIVKATECHKFLAWALPRMGFRPAGFRRVRGQVCKRVARRMRTLGLADLDAYRRRLEADPGEWGRLDSFCRITISRFCRDRPVFEWLERTGLPELASIASAEGRNALSCWSAGCGSGEEPYTLRILWDLCLAARFPALQFEIVATDADTAMLARARQAVYPAGCLRELPRTWIEQAFARMGDEYRLREPFRHGVRFVRQDIRREMPAGPFDVVLCRNLVFTYFDRTVQRSVLSRTARRMSRGGILVIGRNETLPEGSNGFRMAAGASGIFRLQPDGRIGNIDDLTRV
jgi:chemotaxis protein methyltransferase CheR